MKTKKNLLLLLIIALVSVTLTSCESEEKDLGIHPPFEINNNLTLDDYLDSKWENIGKWDRYKGWIPSSSGNRSISELRDDGTVIVSNVKVPYWNYDGYVTIINTDHQYVVVYFIDMDTIIIRSASGWMPGWANDEYVKYRRIVGDNKKS